LTSRNDILQKIDKLQDKKQSPQVNAEVSNAIDLDIALLRKLLEIVDIRAVFMDKNVQSQLNNLSSDQNKPILTPVEFANLLTGYTRRNEFVRILGIYNDIRAIENKYSLNPAIVAEQEEVNYAEVPALNRKLAEEEIVNL
jgi:hypothetical protein